MSGKRINMASLAHVEVQDTPLPGFAAPKTSLPVGDIAPNPCNRRQRMVGIDELAASMAALGQNTPCAVVTTKAFLTVFPEHADLVAGRPYVAVTGRRRQLAAQQAGIAQLEVTVKDEFADSRSRFLAVTASENIDRQSFDAIEEARMVSDLVDECGKAAAAAVQLSRSEGWISQRLALLRLTPALQELVSAGVMPLRIARDIAKYEHGQQEKAWADHQADRDGVGEASEEGTVPHDASSSGDADTGDKSDKTGQGGKSRSESRPRAAAAQIAIRKLGGTPLKIAAALREHLSADDLGELVRALREPEQNPAGGESAAAGNTARPR